MLFDINFGPEPWSSPYQSYTLTTMFSALASMPSTEMALPRTFPLFLLPKHISTTPSKKASAIRKASTSSADSNMTSSSSSSEVETPPSSPAVTGTFFECEVVLTEDELDNPPTALTNDLIAALHIKSPASSSSAATSVCFCREVILTEEDLKQSPSPPKSPRFRNMLSRFARRRRSLC
ncbi:unnamed protein product [Mycena citricolor]|uniref:Uncharacterized protein n=1 Tax=Mycena citricolor TaxID=2018698 RepID=A0AAD2Q6V5_9AGAR|nr:unnamed protein product [Mycena citricolor]